jgi:hypothetical protein
MTRLVPMLTGRVAGELRRTARSRRSWTPNLPALHAASTMFAAAAGDSHVR